PVRIQVQCGYACGTGQSTERACARVWTYVRVRVLGQTRHTGLGPENAATGTGGRRIHGQDRDLVSGLGEQGAERVDERGLADTGHPGDAHTLGLTRVWEQLHQQILSGTHVVGPSGLHECDRPGQGRPVPGQNPLGQSIHVHGRSTARHAPSLRGLPPRRAGTGHAHPSTSDCASSCSRRSTAASAMTVPGGKIAAAPACLSSSKSPGGMTPPTTTMMSERSNADNSSRNAGTRVRCPAAKDDTPITCTSASTAWAATSAGVWNNGPTSTSKPRSAKAVAMTFWPRSCPSWPILATKVRGRRPSTSANSSPRALTRSINPAASVLCVASSLYTPWMVRICPKWRLKTFSIASEISPTVALARAASTAAARRLSVQFSSALEVRPAASVRAAKAARTSPG